MASAHHGKEDLARQQEFMSRFKDQLAGQARRAYPEGRLGGEDDGELAFMVAADPLKGVIKVEFGKPVAWLAMPPEQAEQLAELLMQKVNDLRGK